jgi:hypothetical protein
VLTEQRERPEQARGEEDYAHHHHHPTSSPPPSSSPSDHHCDTAPSAGCSELSLSPPSRSSLLGEVLWCGCWYVRCAARCLASWSVRSEPTSPRTTSIKGAHAPAFSWTRRKREWDCEGVVLHPRTSSPHGGSEPGTKALSCLLANAQPAPPPPASLGVPRRKPLKRRASATAIKGFPRHRPRS